MSNRIKQLINSEMEANWQRLDEGTFEWDVDDVEKFASIIANRVLQECIKECAIVCEDANNGNIFFSRPELLESYNKYLGTGANECIVEIKRHFGLSGD